MHVGKIDWIVTACASIAVADIAKKDHTTSLWWTFEGVPNPQSKKPEEADATSFFVATEEIKNRLLPLLRKIVERDALHSDASPGGDTVRICLADVDSRPFAELLDTLSLHPRPISEIAEADPVKGLNEFREYAYDVGKLKVTDDTVSLDATIPGVKAVICRTDSINSESGKHAVSIAGFAHPQGLSMALSRPGKSERYIRTMSAARKLSASLAEREISEHSHRLIP